MREVDGFNEIIGANRLEEHDELLAGKDGWREIQEADEVRVEVLRERFMWKMECRELVDVIEEHEEPLLFELRFRW